VHEKIAMQHTDSQIQHEERKKAILAYRFGALASLRSERGLWIALYLSMANAVIPI
jgi:hypothetical protein